LGNVSSRGLTKLGTVGGIGEAGVFSFTELREFKTRPLIAVVSSGQERGTVLGWGGGLSRWEIRERVIGESARGHRQYSAGGDSSGGGGIRGRRHTIAWVDIKRRRAVKKDRV